jgi:hypothetical protein
MSPSTRQKLIFSLLPLMVGVVLMQRILDPQVYELHKHEKGSTWIGLNNEFILGPMLGLQQAVAGLLWVRTDEFFHSGDYDAILPMVRMVTWLDPHQLDVYITGAWHLAYNFTDSNERSDRRYIPAAHKLLEEGDENNPQLYDIAFEMGWQNYDKVKDYVRAEEWFAKAAQRKAGDVTGRPTQPVPMFVWHMLAHAQERQGHIQDAVTVWRKALEMSKVKLARNPNDFSIRSTHDSERHNLELTLKRHFSRYVHEIDFNVDRAQTKSINPQTGEPIPNNAYIATDPKRDGVPAGQPRLPATARPWDTAFDVKKITFDPPKVMNIEGQFNVADGARVEIRLHDENWQEKKLKTFTFDVDPDTTIMQDAHSVRGAKWGRKIDMSKDPKMYSFKSPRYFLVFTFNPQQTSPFIQDKFGWNGEGMTDKKYLWVDKSKNPPVRILRKVYLITREQIMGFKPITDADVIPNEEYARRQQQKMASRS